MSGFFEIITEMCLFHMLELNLQRFGIDNNCLQKESTHKHFL